MALKQLPLPEYIINALAEIRPSPQYGANASHELSIGYAPNSRSDYYKVPVRWGPFVDVFGASSEREAKDGPCIMPGCARRDADVDQVCALIFDIDGAASVETVDQLLDNLGVEALLWTTHNHGSSRSTVAASSYRRWATANGLRIGPVTNEPFKRFLSSKPRSAHLRDIQLLNSGKPITRPQRGKHTEVYEFEHAPVDKFRVLFPLVSPIVLKSEHGIGIEGYGAIYTRVGQEVFGDSFDPACKNPSRVHFLPSHRPGAPWSVLYYAGELLDAGKHWTPAVEAKVQEDRLARAQRRDAWLGSPAQGLEQLHAVLGVIPADLSYDDWMRVIAAVYHETKGSEAGIALLHSWSAGDCRYDPEELDGILDWLAEREGQCARPATMGTLIYLAQQIDPNFKLRNGTSNTRPSRAASKDEWRYS